MYINQNQNVDLVELLTWALFSSCIILKALQHHSLSGLGKLLPGQASLNFKLIDCNRHRPISKAERSQPQCHHGKGVIYFASPCVMWTVLKAQESFNQFLSCWSHPLKFTRAALSGMKLSKDRTQQDVYLVHRLTHTHIHTLSLSLSLLLKLLTLDGITPAQPL